MRAKELADRLARNASGVAAHLLPKGKTQGGEWCTGSVDGEEGQSLRVQLHGERAGLWVDFANPDHRGDMLDLWRLARGLDVAQAMQEAGEWLGLPRQPLEEPKRQAPSVSRPKCGVPKSAVRDWLLNDRGLSEAAIAAYRLGEQGRELVMPFLAPGGDLWGVKRRDIGDKHKTRWEKGSVLRLFGWQAIPSDTRSVVICEGEMDALAWFDYGFPALSVPAGATGHKWIVEEFDALDRFDAIYLSFDMDEAGQAGVKELARRLGIERCFVVSLPHKDANDCIKAGVPAEEIAGLIGSARSMDPDELRPVSDYAAAVMQEFWGSEEEIGIRMPWLKVGTSLLLRPGEVSILAGINGHGKSQAAGQIAIDAVSQGEKVCVASMEFKPQKWLKRITRQAACVRKPSMGYIGAVFDWLNGSMWCFDVVGTAKADRLIEVFRYAARRYGVRFFLVDNLAKCGIGEEDYSGQKDFIDKMTDFAKAHDAHVMVVMHMRKSESEHKQSGKMDVKGSGSLTDMVDTLLIIWRNKPKEEARRKHEREQLKLIDYSAHKPFDEGAPDATITCSKQRNGEDEPRIALWFHDESFQFNGGPNQRPRRYVDITEMSNVASF